ncbi:MAG TPA: diguanylate cyclase, partial [Xanthobacteraceae bacterium]|nr:diguanylate cyclase [Xanthobacteraceae bacterium]
MLATAQSQIAADGKRSRWDRARLSLVIPIGAIVAVAIVCVVVAVLTSAHRADEVSLGREQQLLQEAINGKGFHLLRELEAAVATSRATTVIRDQYDADWVDRRIGRWLQAFRNYDVVAIVDANDQVKYALFRDPARKTASWQAELAPVIGLLRGRYVSPPDRTMAIVAPRQLSNSGRSAGLIQPFLGRPAIVNAVAVGSDEQLTSGNIGAPVAITVKFIDRAMLQEIGRRLQLPDLREITNPTDDENTTELADGAGNVIGRFGWKPERPGREIVSSVAPFVAVALAAFAALLALIIVYMRRTAAAIRAGETRLRHLAMHDPVCNLPNRIFFGERLETVINEVHKGGPSAAVFYIDLDHFKDVNDTLGHPIGDALILNVTQRLSRIMRGDDLVARLGGDEFAIITTCESDSYSLQAIAGRIIAAVCAPYSINGHNIIIGASIGIAVIDRRTRDSADILRYADMALYRAKNEGRNRACIYDAAMDADLSNRKLLEGDLLYAIQNGGLQASYQPIVNSSGDKLVGVEALARWTHPSIGEIPPSQFIPIAEHSGLIVELGECMLRKACTDGKAWPGITISVNVSPLQFRRSDFVDVVERILAETKFDANRLELELTESTLLGNLETAELSML